MKKNSQNQRGKKAKVELKKVDDRLERELSEDVSGKQEIEAKEGKEASMKLKSTLDEDKSLTFNDLENTQNTSGETSTSSAKDYHIDKLSNTSKSGTTKSSASSSEEGEDFSSNNSDSQDNEDGNVEYEHGYDDEDDVDDDGEDEENISVNSQSAEIDVDDDEDETSKVNIIKDKVKSPKSIASCIKD